jgi:hypothetical protein
MHLLQFLRYDGLPPFPFKHARLFLCYAFTAALRAGPPSLATNERGLDDRAIKIERRNARRRSRREMDAVQTAARWTEGGREPFERLLLGLLISCSAFLEDWEN